jgi:hypothetical protein
VNRGGASEDEPSDLVADGAAEMQFAGNRQSCSAPGLH